MYDNPHVLAAYHEAWSAAHRLARVERVSWDLAQDAIQHAFLAAPHPHYYTRAALLMLCARRGVRQRRAREAVAEPWSLHERSAMDRRAPVEVDAETPSVAVFVESLPEPERGMAEALMAGLSLREVSRMFDVDDHTVKARLRARFQGFAKNALRNPDFRDSSPMDDAQ
jgi:DNA-directed RNA polymerase specialized sigma24 family protein